MNPLVTDRFALKNNEKGKTTSFTSVTHDYNSADKLEVGGTLICHRLLEKKKTEKGERFYTISFKRSFFKTLKEGKKKTSCCSNYDVQK